MAADKPDPADDLAQRRERLSAELARTEASLQQGPRKSTGWGEATKIASEFVAGIVVGVAFGLIVGLLLGFAAGTLNVLRAQGFVAEAGAKLRGEPPKGAVNPTRTDDKAD